MSAVSRACPLLQTCDIVIQYVTYSSHTRYTKESVGNASLGGRLATSSSHTVLRAFWSEKPADQRFSRILVKVKAESSSIKSQVHSITTKEGVQSQIREGQHLVYVHHSSRHTTRKQHLFTAEAFHLPARPVLREYSYRVLVAGKYSYRVLLKYSRRPDPKHDRNPAADRNQVRRDSSPLLHRHEDVGPTVVDRR